MLPQPYESAHALPIWLPLMGDVIWVEIGLVIATGRCNSPITLVGGQ